MWSFSLEEEATWEASSDHKSFHEAFCELSIIKSKIVVQVDENEYVYYGKMLSDFPPLCHLKMGSLNTNISESDVWFC